MKGPKRDLEIDTIFTFFPFYPIDPQNNTSKSYF